MKEKLTIVIKTFNRKKALIRLLKSIETLYGDLPIIIVDDSSKNYKKEVLQKFPKLNINYLVEEFDIGLAKGRNILVNNVKTDFFLLCDDDFEFDERTNLKKYLEVCDSRKVDILGGMVYNRMSIDSVYALLWTLKDIKRLKYILNKTEIKSIYNGQFTVSGKDIRLSINDKIEDYAGDKLYETDICSNFFIGNTAKVKKIGGWTPELLKVGEHELFFLKAKKNNLIVRFCPHFGVVHYPKKKLSYVKFRLRAADLFNTACDLDNNINSFIVTVRGRDKYSYHRKHAVLEEGR